MAHVFRLNRRRSRSQGRNHDRQERHRRAAGPHAALRAARRGGPPRGRPTRCARSPSTRARSSSRAATPGREIYLVVTGRVRLSVLTGGGTRAVLRARRGRLHLRRDRHARRRPAQRRRDRRQQGDRAQPVEARLQAADGYAARSSATPPIRFLCSRVREADQQLEAHRALPDRRPARALLPRRRASEGARQRGGPRRRSSCRCRRASWRC